MQRLCSASRFLVFRRVPAPPPSCWWPARQGDPIMAAPFRSARHVQRRGIQCEELGASDRRSPDSSAIQPVGTSIDTRIALGKHFPITKGTSNEKNKGEIQELPARYGKDDGRKNIDAVYGDVDANRPTLEFSNCKQDVTEDAIADSEEEEDVWRQSESEVSDDEEYSSQPADDHSAYVSRLLRMQACCHRDGSIYRVPAHWKEFFRIADRNETRLEPMMLSDPNRHCLVYDGICDSHEPGPMWQVFSIKLSKIHIDCGSVEVYGYIAARDRLEPLLNYIVNISRENPVTVTQGSLIKMIGPKRGIDLAYSLLIEYDMRIKNGDREEEDLQLIDGAGIIDEIYDISPKPYTKRIRGNYGAVDINQMCLKGAVEATVEVFISEMQDSFSLCISCFTSGLNPEIQLFDGLVGGSRGLRMQHVIAVIMDSSMDLKFKIGGSGSSEHYCSFKAVNHGRSSKEINIELASVLVKVTWSTLKYSLI